MHEALHATFLKKLRTRQWPDNDPTNHENHQNHGAYASWPNSFDQKRADVIKGLKCHIPSNCLLHPSHSDVTSYIFKVATWPCSHAFARPILIQCKLMWQSNQRSGYGPATEQCDSTHDLCNIEHSKLHSCHTWIKLMVSVKSKIV